MFTVRVSTLYPLASADDVRPGTIGLYFSASGAAEFTTAVIGVTPLAPHDDCSITAVAGVILETGPLYSVTTLPAGTLGIVGR